MKKIIAPILSLAMLSVAGFALATAGPTSGYIQNPLGNITSPESLVTLILGLVVRIGSVLAVLFLIYSGFLFVKARGNSTEVEKAKTTFFWTIVGIAILLGAQAISTIVVGTITRIR